MNLHKIRIVGTIRGGTVEIDGTELKGVVSANIAIAAGEIPTVTLCLLTDKLTVESDCALIQPKQGES